MATEFGFRYVFSDYVDDVSGYYADVSLFDASAHPDAALARQLSYRAQHRLKAPFWNKHYVAIHRTVIICSL